MRIFQAATALSILALAGCSSVPVARYSVAPPPVSESIKIAYGSVEIRDISLPSYAASEELHIEDETGAFSSDNGVLWADAPERAVSLELSRNLAQLTGARVANEPWPFQRFPDARVEVRVAELIAGHGGEFRLNGQYFVTALDSAGLDGVGERSALFSLTAPFDPAGGPAAIANARGQVIFDLAKLIARDGL